MLNRSTRGRINCKFNRRIVLLLLAVAGLPLSTYADQFCVILDPYFYRSPIKIDLEGTTKTVLAFYRIVDSETLAPAKPQELTEEAQSAGETGSHSTAPSTSSAGLDQKSSETQTA